MSTKTKKDLETTINTLKEEIRRLRGEVKNTESSIEGLTNVAYGVILVEKEFKLVTVKFDPESKNAVVEDIADLGKSVGNAAVRVRTKVVDTVVELDKIRKRR